MAIAKQNAGHLLNLVNDMLDISKIDSGKEIFPLSLFSAKEVFDIVSDIAKMGGKERGLDIITEYELKDDEQIYSCKDALIKICTNLVGNALKFTDRGGFVKIHLYKDAKYYHFSVQDNGIGIDKDDFKKIWEKFGQAGNSLNKQNKGTGLGLYIVKKATESL